MLSEPIGYVEDPKWYEETSFIDSNFVEVVENEFIHVDMQYPQLKMKKAEPRCFLRKDAYELLEDAGHMLPEGMRFRIWDAWRPFELQEELYYAYSAQIIRDFNLQGKSKEEQDATIGKYVAIPKNTPSNPPAHTTGGAIDLTIETAEGNILDMGSGFDEFSARTQTTYYESSDNEIVKNNRRMLFNIMTNAGFTNLPSEWWHYDYGDMNWAYLNSRPAIYKGVFTKNEINME
ncbi:MAG: D-alanyl-D-alanine carboxypeptidase family protein [Pseudobutyrivibrio sp.]|nr:D-alanyl-D-alanine carboxypeptidase family protein [Pseudobutyrivibrio sp.]